MAIPQNFQCGCTTLTMPHPLIHGLEMTAFVMGTVVSLVSSLHHVHVSCNNEQVKAQRFLHAEVG